MRRRSVTSARVFAVFGLLGLAFFIIWKASAPGRAQRKLAAARQALSAERFAEAADLVSQALRQTPDHGAALLVQAGTAAAMGCDDRLEQSWRALQRLAPRNRPRDLLSIGDLFIGQGRLSAAERYFRGLNELERDNLDVQGRLALLLELEGRRWEARPFLFDLVCQGKESPEILVFLGNRAIQLDISEQLRRAHRLAPTDAGPCIGLARLATNDGDEETAEQLLRAALQSDPNAIEAQALLGNLLAGRPREFLQWHERLPLSANDHPDVWQARGAFAARTGDFRTGARCYWEAAQRDSNHRQAYGELARLLELLAQTEHIAALRQRAESLQTLEVELGGALGNQRDAARCLEIARHLEQLGRLWEARGWYRVILTLEPESDAAQREAERLSAMLAPAPARAICTTDIASQIDLSNFPLPPWTTIETRAPVAERREIPVGVGGKLVRFEDQAGESGLQFTYYGSSRAAGSGWRLHETNGGGVAAIDFDLDGWPDIYFVQGCDWPPAPDRHDHVDLLFRNVDGRQFIDVTAAAGLGDERYGQGVAAGDHNNDGFPDLLVGNVGQNRLYGNNGDGTFLDVTLAAGIIAPGWTTSCVIADLNGDSHPDLFEARYVADSDATQRQCSHRGALPRACPPYVFEAEEDRFWLGRGDGTFVDAGPAAGIVLRDGYGLGVVAADLDLSGRLGIFVANDGMPNFWLVNESLEREEAPQFSDWARRAGLAVAADGLPRAGMAAVVEDVDGDGLPDVLITNYYHEGNRLYHQQQPGLFVDSSREAGLFAPCFDKLGFGAQAIDCDLDGWPDLFIANGHVDDFSHQGIPFRMRPQLLRNNGSGAFIPLAAADLGDYFMGEYLGRGVARLDWNGDGREDLVVSHLDTAAALLTNATADCGRFLAVELKGTESSRDAIGATIRCTCAGRSRLRQLTAGDGYLSANQKQLVFGLGDTGGPVTLEIAWPSGQRQTYGGLPVDRSVLIAEGRQTADLKPLRMRR